jgi:hypothetical protein
MAALNAISPPDADGKQSSKFIASRVSRELENDSLPPIRVQARVSPLSIPHPTAVLGGNQSYTPVLVIGATVAVMLLCVAAIIIVFFGIQGDDEPSAVSQATDTAIATASTEASPSPVITPIPTLLPMLVPLQNGVGLSNGRRISDGGMQVQGYCNPQYLEGYTAVSHDNDHWYCHRSQGSSDRAQLTQEDFDRICQLTYSNPNAVAIQSDGPSIPAFSWKCFGPIGTDSSTPG